MPQIQQQEVVRSILERLIAISGRKTDKIYALMTLEILIKDLQPEFTFLKDIKINDDFYTEDAVTSVNLASTLNDIIPTDLGKALQAIITRMNRSLGNKAGHFFVKELRNTLSDDCLTSMHKMGVDLGLMQLESEVNDLHKHLTHQEQTEDDDL
jgi:hypothetical protein